MRRVATNENERLLRNGGRAAYGARVTDRMRARLGGGARPGRRRRHRRHRRRRERRAPLTVVVPATAAGAVRAANMMIDVTRARRAYVTAGPAPLLGRGV